MNDDGQELYTKAIDWIETNVLRLVAVKLVPLIVGTGALNAVLAWLSAELGLDLDPAVVTAWIGVTMAGVIAIAFEYVRNHGRGAAVLGSAMLTEQKVRQAGREALGTDEEPEPAGLEGEIGPDR